MKVRMPGLRTRLHRCKACLEQYSYKPFPPGRWFDSLGSFVHEDWEARPTCMKLRQLQIEWETSRNKHDRLRMAIKIHGVTWGVSLVKGAAEVGFEVAKHLIISKVLKMLW